MARKIARGSFHPMVGKDQLREYASLVMTERDQKKALETAMKGAPRGGVEYKFHKAHVQGARVNYREARSRRLNFQRDLQVLTD